jgi:vacuolar-type H+-ATPase subunit H
MSDKSLEQLITSLKTEAIEAAEKESKKILEEANSRARQIIQTAEEIRDKSLLDAENEAKSILYKGEGALRRAARDFSVSVRNDLLKTLQAVLEKEVQREFSPDLIKTAIIKVIENIGSHVELSLPTEFSNELAEYIHMRLQTSAVDVSITEDNTALNCITIAKTGEGWSYHISPEEIAEALRLHLTSNWVKIIKNEGQK